MNCDHLQDIYEFRHAMHRDPELSGNEQKTADRIIHILKKYPCDELLINLGGYGIAAIYNGAHSGDTILFRADFDAVPVHEQNDLPFQSSHPQIAHQCGHDGHTAILVGLAKKLHLKRPKYGRIVLLFQPAEEIGTGAKAIVNDPKFKSIQPDYAFALHNEPGTAPHTITLKSGTICMASKGIQVIFTGKSAHASTPENATSPGQALMDLFSWTSSYGDSLDSSPHFRVITTLGYNLIFLSYGTTPEVGEFNAVLRGASDGMLDQITTEMERKIHQLADRDSLQVSIQYFDNFPATVNHPTCVDIITDAAQKNGFPIQMKKTPWRGSEDFGHIINSASKGGAIFMLGIGESSPLHTPEYQFNDAVIPTGIEMFWTIIQTLSGE